MVSYSYNSNSVCLSHRSDPKCGQPRRPLNGPDLSRACPLAIKACDHSTEIEVGPQVSLFQVKSPKTLVRTLSSLRIEDFGETNEIL